MHRADSRRLSHIRNDAELLQDRANEPGILLQKRARTDLGQYQHAIICVLIPHLGYARSLQFPQLLVEVWLRALFLERRDDWAADWLCVQVWLKKALRTYRVCNLPCTLCTKEGQANSSAMRHSSLLPHSMHSDVVQQEQFLSTLQRQVHSRKSDRLQQKHI